MTSRYDLQEAPYEPSIHARMHPDDWDAETIFTPAKARRYHPRPKPRGNPTQDKANVVQPAPSSTDTQSGGAA